MASSQRALKKDLEILSPALSPSWDEDKLWMLTERWSHTDLELQLHRVWSSFKLCFQSVLMHAAWKLFTSLCADKIPSYEYARKQSPWDAAGQIH